MAYVYDDAANRRLADLLNSLTEDLVERLNPRAVLLTGSLGRGEGSAELRDGDLVPLSDCELVILPLTPAKKRTAEQIITPYSNHHEIDIDVSGVVKSLQLLTPLVRRMQPTIDNYDLRYGSTLLHGRDYRESIPAFEPAEIPAWEGFRLVFNRMAKLLSTEVDRAYWLDKLILALRDAVLISASRYSPSYDRRQQMFETADPQEFPVDSETYQMLQTRARAATKRRHTCSLLNSSEDRIEELIGLIEQVLISLADAHFGECPPDLRLFRQAFLENPITQGYHRFPGRSPLIQNALSTGRHLTEAGEFPPLIRPMTNWSHDIYTTIPLALVDRFDSSASTTFREVIESTVSRYHSAPNEEPSVYDALMTCWERYCW